MNGGDFYALTDDQLQRLLAGELAHAAFLQKGGGEQPREAFARVAKVWYELSQVLHGEAACGAEQTDKIPAMVGFSYSQQVQATAGQIAALPETEIRTRCAGALMEASVDEVLVAVRDLQAFYQRAAANKDAVLFRVS